MENDSAVPPWTYANTVRDAVNCIQITSIRPASRADTLTPKTDNTLQRRLIRWTALALGAAAVLLGLVTFWLPLPVGVPLVFFGGLLLTRHSMVARRAVAGASRRYPRVRGILRRLRNRWRRNRSAP